MVFHIWSDSFKDGDLMPQAQVYNGMGQKGQNLSPPLRWSGAPKGTKSFVITIFDPDAPTGSGWWHWVVVNIPPDVDFIPEGASSKNELPEGSIQVKNDFGQYNYGGAAPPPGLNHHYVITIHALDVSKLDVNKDNSPASIGFNVHHHSLGSAKITCIYGNKTNP